MTEPAQPTGTTEGAIQKPTHSDSGATHTEGKWCADLHCSKCYSADAWQKSKISELERKLNEIMAQRDREFELRQQELDKRVEAEAAVSVLQSQYEEADTERMILRKRLDEERARCIAACESKKVPSRNSVLMHNLAIEDCIEAIEKGEK